MVEYRSVTTDPVRFGVFEIDPSARELRKHGVRIKLQDQPFSVLLMLLRWLESRGESGCPEGWCIPTKPVV